MTRPLEPQVEARWPIAPVVRYLTESMGGPWSTTNSLGYTAERAGALFGLSRDGWMKRVARGVLDDRAADKIAVTLGLHPVDFWPSWFDAALEVDYDPEVVYRPRGRKKAA